MLNSDELAQLEKFLDPSWIVVVATIGRDGMPHLTPNWYVFEDGRVAVSTTKETVKYTNLSRDGRVSLCVNTEPRAKEYAAIRGEAEILDDESIWPITRHIVERYMPSDKVEERMAMLRKQNRVILSVKPDRVTFR